MFARPAAEIRPRFAAVPLALAQRARCEAEILARAAALILRGPRDPRVDPPNA